jgi:hypothetical protein
VLLLSSTSYDSFIDHAKLVSTILAIAGFLFGIFQYRKQQVLNRTAAAESRDREFLKPLWEKQLAIYFDTSQAAATIATTTDPKERQEAKQKFWTLYWGPLMIVESPTVYGAMKAFGECLTGETQGNLQDLSLELGSPLQASLTEGANLRWPTRAEEERPSENNRQLKRAK